MSVYEDVWSIRVPENKLQAYKQMMNEKQIELLGITYDRSTKRTIFKYEADLPHEKILEELAKRC